MSSFQMEGSSAGHQANHSNLIELKFDLSVLYGPLTDALNAMSSRMSKIEQNSMKLQQTLEKEISSVYSRIDDESHQVGLRQSDSENKIETITNNYDLLLK